MHAPDRVPDAAAVTEEFNCCLADGCDTPERCWTTAGCATMRLRSVDPRPGARKKDSKAIRKALLAHRECACGVQASDGHHVLLRSQGGDDTFDNIRPLCHHCHMAFHQGDDDAVVTVGQGLLQRNIDYVMTKLGPVAGADYLWRVYRLRVKRWQPEGEQHV